MLCFLRKGENLQTSAKISEKLRLGSVCPLSFVPLRAPWLWGNKTPQVWGKWRSDGGSERLSERVPGDLWEMHSVIIGHIPKATLIQKAPSPELWWTFAGTLVNVRELILNMMLWVRQSSPNFAMLRQSSHEGARMLPVYPGICLRSSLHSRHHSQRSQEFLLKTVSAWRPFQN